VVVAGRPSVSAATREPDPSDSEGVPYGWFADKAYRWLDWLPVRLAAAGFAIVGNFEDAVYCWRAASAVHTGEAQRRILLMTGSGALGVRLADPTLEADMRGADRVLGEHRQFRVVGCRARRQFIAQCGRFGLAFGRAVDPAVFDADHRQLARPLRR
jgi:hypothetical protein